MVPDFVVEAIKTKAPFGHRHLTGKLKSYPIDDKSWVYGPQNHPMDHQSWTYELYFVGRIGAEYRFSNYRVDDFELSACALFTHGRWYVTEDFVSITTASMSNLLPHLGDFAIVDREVLSRIQHDGLVGYLKRKTR